MDTKSLHCKHPKKMKPTKDKHEVFVLPPDLLKKLGISIGNVGQVVSNDVAAAPCTQIMNNENPESTNISSCNQTSGSSILETASLMKKSVFLSPTFVSTIANVIPGEVEILSKNNPEESIDVAEFTEPKNDVFVPLDCIQVKNVFPEASDTQSAFNKADEADLSYDFTVNGGNSPESNINHVNPQFLSENFDSIKVSETLNKIERRLGNIVQAYSCTTQGHVEYSSSIGQEDTAAVSFKASSVGSVPKVSKINIISEETIPLSKLRELKKSQFKNLSNLTPVTVKCIIDAKSNHLNCDTREQTTVDHKTDVLVENTPHTNPNYTKLMPNDEYIATIAGPSEIEATDRLEVAKNIINDENMCESTQDDSMILDDSLTHTTLLLTAHNDWELSDKNEMHNENKVCKSECQLDAHNRNIENVDAVNGFIGHENEGEFVDSYNGKMDETIETEYEQRKSHHGVVNENESNKDNVEKPNAKLKESKPRKGNLKQKMCSKNDSQHTKTIIDDTMYNKTMEDTSEHQELASILNASKQLSSSSSGIKVDKVKEIAAYLKKFSHIYTDKKKTKTALVTNINRVETANSNSKLIESKLCIQGVEKPGGNTVIREHPVKSKVVKTYSRQKPPKESKLSTYMLQNIKSSDKIEVIDHKNNTDSISAPTSIMQQFCSCFDFGRLAYYDYDNLYEHIHFWQHKTVDCEIDLIFTIYNDEAIISNKEGELELEEKLEERVEAYNICWNVFDEVSENLDKSKPQIVLDDNGTVELKGGGEGFSERLQAQQIFREENYNIALRENYSDVSKSQDKAQMKYNYDNILEIATNHDNIEDTVKSRNNKTVNNEKTNKNTEKLLNGSYVSESSAVITVTDNERIDPEINITQTELPSTSRLVASSSEIPLLDEAIKKNIETKEEICKNKNPVSSSQKNLRKEEISGSPKSFEKNMKRRLTGNTTLASHKITDEPSSKKTIKCGLCNNLFSRENWEDHVANQHHLIAWKAGGSINLDDPNLLDKLKQRLKSLGKLTCSICNLETKKCNKLIEHMKYCIKQKISNTKDKLKRKSRTVLDEDVTCGVCQKTVQSSGWLEHIGRNHDYLAWSMGQDALNLDDESEVWQHLQNIIRLNGRLTCYKCGLNRGRVKLYLSHIKTCDGNGISIEEPPKNIDLNTSIIPEDDDAEQAADESVKCGVCEQDVASANWIEHIAKEHNYLAWRDGDTPLDLNEEEAVWNHLQQLIRQNGGLTCHKCGLVRKRVKLYLVHVETCDGTNSHADVSSISSNNISLDTTTKSSDGWFEVPVVEDDKKIIKCGVCNEEVPITEWIEHIGKTHDYLAWQDGNEPLNLEDESAIKLYLLDISRQSGGLICNKCDKRIKYPKTYLQHIKECTGATAASCLEDGKLDNSTSSWIELLSNDQIKEEKLTCAVCATTVETTQWINHIEIHHQYLAWPEGQTPLDVDDAAVVQRHLYDISKMIGGLLCIKCGLKRKYVKSYQHHVETCQGKSVNNELSSTLMSQDHVECAVCGEKMEPKKWRDHSLKKHYNIAWVVGDIAIDLNNPYAVETYLKEYHNLGYKLVCKVCGISRVSYVGFYAHIITCGKTEEETDMYKNTCDICHNKYLIIYKSQHMTMHREKEYALERRLLAAKEKELKKEEPKELIQTGRRKAAEKAKTVIEKYKDTLHDGSYRCSKCRFNCEVETELSEHVCVEEKWGDASDSDESVKLENCSDEDTDESDIDSNVSDEEREACAQSSSKKKRYSDTNSSAAKIPRLPYSINNASIYMKRSTEEFIEIYLADKDLFPQWRTCEFEEVPENEIVNYMPPIEESCKVRFDNNQDWMTFNRFEANKIKDTIVLFTGASIQCMSWSGPCSIESTQQYLCVATHRREDVPRHAWDATADDNGLIQIWDCGNLISRTPTLALGIAHSYGTVWALDWCPSGARDDLQFVSESNTMQRLGLLAAAFSNGSAYIFVVPYPSSITEKEKAFYKLKPVVELRLASKDNRKKYQATAIKWSMQKGHSHVVVGYADGTTAFYDLNGESPLLRTTENNITVFYPYHDERVQNSCIEDLDMYPCGGGGSRAGGVVCVGSAGGAAAGALQSHVAAARVLYPPHWPAALLAGDDCLVNLSINELEWWGGGRRLGGMQEAAGCAWCGRVAAAAPPLLRLMRLHPCFPEVHKQVIGKIQMVPLGNKRKRQNDELAMIVEPITYGESIKKYGIEFIQVTSKDRATQQKFSTIPRDAYPERFPLSDVAAMEFCPSFKHHHKLAIAVHAGLVFIINV